ncbi:condensin complex subunit 2 isoform X1 [Dermacentor albipictus]|uniref:condensin complex subunit 2 isoform X1 n=1 Tax=Dermacentor albipictus TaxID=60249 RepID=UPI0031FCACCE
MEDTFTTPPRRQAKSTRASFVDSALQAPNDDCAERHSRQQELLQELHSLHIESPGTPGRKRRSVGLVPPTFTDVQLAEHYASCIRLANENKITSKNAFQLHLIDHIRKVLQAEDGTTNFQSASCTLDASAKIYAHRVDHVHSEALHIAGELGISSRIRKRELKAQAKNEDPDQPAVATKGRAKRTKGRGSSTLVRNEKTITIEKVETVRPIDPLQELIRVNSTCGTSDCFVMNHIYSFSDRGELMFLDASRKLESIKDTRSKAPIDYLQRCLNNRNGVCEDPGLVCMWNESVEAERHDDPGLSDMSSLHIPNSSVAATEERGPSLPYVGDCNDLDDGSADLFEDACRSPERPDDLIKGGMSELVKYLAPVPQDYSYFTDKLPFVPHGPEHWRLRIGKAKAAGPVRTRKKVEKVVPLLDFAELQPDFTQFARLKKDPVLENATINSWSKSKNLMAHKKNGEDISLGTLVLLEDHKIPKLVISSTGHAAGEDAHSSPDSGLPPDMNDDSNMSLDHAVDVGPPNPVELLPPPPPRPELKPLVSFHPKPPKFQFSFKRFDMKDMKQAMWRTLTGNRDNKENIPSSANVLDKAAITKHTFRSLYEHVQPQLNHINRESLNVPVAFVALLHLAAEKEFFVVSVPDMTDLEIKLQT